MKVTVRLVGRNAVGVPTGKEYFSISAEGKPAGADRTVWVALDAPLRPPMVKTLASAVHNGVVTLSMRDSEATPSVVADIRGIVQAVLDHV